MARSFRALIILVLLAGCAHRAPVPVAVAPPPIFVPPTAVPMPAGASPNMQIPAMLADGRYPTPSDGLSRPAALWHLRVALNVAALACRGPAGDAIAARYNALIADRRAAFATAQTALAGEYRKVSTNDWQDALDDEMTRLYNYYALAPARSGFCGAAARVLAAIPAIAPDGLADYAPAGLADLDRPFTDFFRAYDAWRSQRGGGAAIAMLAPVPAARVAPKASVPAIPRLEVDPAIFR